MATFQIIRMILLILFLVVECHHHAHALADCLEADRRALIDFKTGLDDPRNVLSSWQGANCCQWWGITCHNRTGAVIAVDLHNSHCSDYVSADSIEKCEILKLGGEIRPSLKKLKSLRLLDLSFNGFNQMPIPKILGSLENLQYLDLSNAGFSGPIPPNLGNLSRLHYLDVSCSDSGSPVLIVDSLDWLGGLVSLNHLDMSRVNLSKVTSDWLSPLNNLPSLTELHLSSCSLLSFNQSLPFRNFTSLALIDLRFNSFYSEIPSWLFNVSSLVSIDLRESYLYGRIRIGFSELPNLMYLDLSWNDKLTANCYQLFNGNWNRIKSLDIASNNLYGELPVYIGNMTSLHYLDLSDNSIEGSIPDSIGKLCNLTYFDLSSNNLTGSLPEFRRGAQDCYSNGPFPNLRDLGFSNNHLVGKLPEWLGQLQNLVTLDLYNNSIQGNLPDSLGQLSELSKLYLSFNSLTGIISQVHFSKLSKLEALELSHNSFILNVSSNWVPPFQLQYLHMASCKLGPSFPLWLKTQKQLQLLDLSNANISGPIPNWFWNISGSVSQLNLSFNELQGQVPNSLNLAGLSLVDLSSNLFQGSIPLLNDKAEFLFLSNNQFSGPIPKTIGKHWRNLFILNLSGNQLSGSIPSSIREMGSLLVIDLSRNNLSGSIPSRIGTCSHLLALDLQSNDLSGVIPRSLGSLINLQSLHLTNNKISGEIPSSFKYLMMLETLDLGNNCLTGQIPPWIGDGFPKLRILSLRLNRFSGRLPSAISNLSSLQVLDLAQNDFNGSIPSTFGELKAMAQEQKINYHLVYGSNFFRMYYQESFVVNIKNLSLKYTNNLSLLTCIDLSGNKLHGKLPEDITKLKGLVVLNLTGNHIHGQVPTSISSLHQLASLDLSNNSFSGPIPASMSSLDFLGYLNLSNNHFSGKIPYTEHMMTFDASVFAGNPGLCGAPLVNKCTADHQVIEKTVDDPRANDNWLYLSIGMGFSAGVLVPFFILAIKRPWSDAYFALVDVTADRLSYLVHKVAVSC